MTKVLVLDDNLPILEAISFILSRRKIEVITLNDPAMLESSLQDHNPDLLLMDIALGQYDGRNLCRQLKHRPGLESLPIVLFTAKYFSKASIDASKADAVIEKPFRIQELYAVLDRFLHPSHS
ncbi:MAG TPA: response regulator [Chitinophaga sp.]|uniref:response regulator n=1 Tax=Chitinophaga sp. TaxID=1869181 RepID=UPI002DBEAD1D|nr:response regulator [Chitinophaga sp.]HEU4551492.1 response regulator [Chitinophaga sp.]